MPRSEEPALPAHADASQQDVANPFTLRSRPQLTDAIIKRHLGDEILRLYAEHGGPVPIAADELRHELRDSGIAINEKKMRRFLKELVEEHVLHRTREGGGNTFLYSPAPQQGVLIAATTAQRPTRRRPPKNARPGSGPGSGTDSGPGSGPGSGTEHGAELKSRPGSGTERGPGSGTERGAELKPWCPDHGDAHFTLNPWTKHPRCSAQVPRDSEHPRGFCNFEPPAGVNVNPVNVLTEDGNEETPAPQAGDVNPDGTSRTGFIDSYIRRYGRHPYGDPNAGEPHVQLCSPRPIRSQQPKQNRRHRGRTIIA